MSVIDWSVFHGQYCPRGRAAEAHQLRFAPLASFLARRTRPSGVFFAVFELLDDAGDADDRLVRVPSGPTTTPSSPAASSYPSHQVSAPKCLPTASCGPKTTPMTPVTGWSEVEATSGKKNLKPHAKLPLHANFQLRSYSEAKSPALNTQIHGI